jgi:hypothetical protein
MASLFFPSWKVIVRIVLIGISYLSQQGLSRLIYEEGFNEPDPLICMRRVSTNLTL